MTTPTKDYNMLRNFLIIAETARVLEHKIPGAVIKQNEADVQLTVPEEYAEEAQNLAEQVRQKVIAMSDARVDEEVAKLRSNVQAKVEEHINAKSR